MLNAELGLGWGTLVWMSQLANSSDLAVARKQSSVVKQVRPLHCLGASR